MKANGKKDNKEEQVNDIHIFHWLKAITPINNIDWCMVSVVSGGCQAEHWQKHKNGHPQQSKDAQTIARPPKRNSKPGVFSKKICQKNKVNTHGCIGEKNLRTMRARGFYLYNIAKWNIYMNKQKLRREIVRQRERERGKSHKGSVNDEGAEQLRLLSVIVEKLKKSISQAGTAPSCCCTRLIIHKTHKHIYVIQALVLMN